jgi:hypothetical protein
LAGSRRKIKISRWSREEAAVKDFFITFSCEKRKKVVSLYSKNFINIIKKINGAS